MSRQLSESKQNGQDENDAGMRRPPRCTMAMYGGASRDCVDRPVSIESTASPKKSRHAPPVNEDVFTQSNPPHRQVPNLVNLASRKLDDKQGLGNTATHILSSTGSNPQNSNATSK